MELEPPTKISHLFYTDSTVTDLQKPGESLQGSSVQVFLSMWYCSQVWMSSLLVSPPPKTNIRCRMEQTPKPNLPVISSAIYVSYPEMISILKHVRLSEYSRVKSDPSLLSPPKRKTSLAFTPIIFEEMIPFSKVFSRHLAKKISFSSSVFVSVSSRTWKFFQVMFSSTFTLVYRIGTTIAFTTFPFS